MYQGIVDQSVLDAMGADNKLYFRAYLNEKRQAVLDEIVDEQDW